MDENCEKFLLSLKSVIELCENDTQNQELILSGKKIMFLFASAYCQRALLLDK